jgi:N-methylhydantoinase B/oxoprolinase/acetone carboxylase alpha subunit
MERRAMTHPERPAFRSCGTAFCRGRGTGQALIRAAFSPIVRECGDISAGIFDRQGRMLAQAVTGTPGHINTMAEAVKTLSPASTPQTWRPATST